jgi:citrate synthase
MAENGLSGSSFTARIVASTRTSLVCAHSAPGAFTGPRRRSICSTRGQRQPMWTNGDPRAQAPRVAMRRMGSASERLAFVEHVEQRVAAVLARVKPGR